MQGVPRPKRTKSGTSALRFLGVLLGVFGFGAALLGSIVIGLLVFVVGVVLVVAPGSARTNNSHGRYGRRSTSRVVRSSAIACPKCRWKNPPVNEFCGKCGMDLKDVTRMYDSGLPTRASTQARKI